MDSAFGCRALGASYRYGVGEKQDFTKAMQFYNKSCSNADGNGCYNVALMYQNGQGAAQNLDEAQTYAYRSCTLDFEAGCVLHEKILALMQKDTLTKQAEELLQQCEQNDGIACGNIAFYYDHGLQGATRNPTNFSLGSLYEHGGINLKQDTKKALECYQESCDMGLENACVYFSNLKESLK